MNITEPGGIKMWRELSKEEVEEFESWADKSFAPDVKMEINRTWHPVVQQRCHEIMAAYWKRVSTLYIEGGGK